ncbi:hypothetical protein [Sanguibacter sp. HDW7]|uniref:hypothetical protein n=1 Tax=Sanguibacter sp. HDW7 TaxID=2714931 RepID=UPI00140AEA18|nr:hypothetical protein [Sanguibacter sp. HDW7]QIK83015.1 hypothetical protein G7063_04770 [Sanguibacter sp. HDW7]
MNPWIVVAIATAALVAGYGLGVVERATDARALAGLTFDALDDADLAMGIQTDLAVQAARTAHVVHAVTGVVIDVDKLVFPDGGTFADLAAAERDDADEEVAA